MATKLKHKQPAADGNGNVTPITSKCTAEGCKKNTERMTFCREHYDWFKFGLITKEGKRPIDFDKKYATYLKTRGNKAA